MRAKLLLAVGATAILCACTSSDGGNRHQRTVRTVRPLVESGITDRHLSGTVTESREISLGFKTAGQINGIYVKEGDYVRKGTLLASLDDVDYAVSAEGLRAQAMQLKSEFERSRKLYEQKSMSLNDYEKIKAAYAQVESQLKSLDNKLAYTRLYAPVNGHIRSVNFSRSEMVDAGTPVFNLLDDSAIEIVVDIPATLYKSIDRIAGITVIHDDSPTAIPLQILSVVPKADSNQLFRMKLIPAGRHDRTLTPGTNVDVAIRMGATTDNDETVMIPAHSIMRSNDTTFVWVVGQDSTLRRRDIVISDMNQDGKVAVRRGLDGTEDVVISGVSMLREGDKVKILENPSKSNVGGLL
ncbi:MAG: efflux RND transporter periplasmic adaptor subunit [Pseudoflavonifractor sp.]|nr:efflux RND transporter periplasmic adaptor subunit [Pseudoflavonifractor sp.]